VTVATAGKGIAWAARQSNLECGILIRGGPQPRAIRDHITGLHAAGVLLRL